MRISVLPPFGARNHCLGTGPAFWERPQSARARTGPGKAGGAQGGSPPRSRPRLPPRPGAEALRLQQFQSCPYTFRPGRALSCLHDLGRKLCFQTGAQKNNSSFTLLPFPSYFHLPDRPDSDFTIPSIQWWTWASWSVAWHHGPGAWPRRARLWRSATRDAWGPLGCKGETLRCPSRVLDVTHQGVHPSTLANSADQNNSSFTLIPFDFNSDWPLFLPQSRP
jgi:hypothetical protein